MTKTLFIDSVQTVKKSMVIFISIVFFTMLCVALYTGMEWSTASMPQSVQESMEDADLYDIRLLYDHGLSEADLQKIAQIDGVDEVTGSRMGYETFVHHGNRYVQARILKITDSVNRPVNVTGKLPETGKEAAVSKAWAEDNDIKIGDILPFLPEEGGFPALSEKELTVTAFMDTLEYNELNVPGYGVSEQNQLAVGCILYVTEEAFNPVIYRGDNLVLIRSDRLRNVPAFADEYKTEAGKIKDSITEALSGTDLAGFVLTDRTYLPAVIVPKNLTVSLGNVKTILVSVFLIIGLLICYGSIIRMVSDQSYLIGTKMAMGVRPGEIRLQYCFYTGSAVLLGCLLGGFLGRFIAGLLLSVCSKNYAVPFSLKTDLAPFLTVCSFEIVPAIFVTLLGVRAALKNKVIDLLSGNKAVSAKGHVYERFPLWNRLSLFAKAVINNFFNEKKRVLQTMIGIVGSTTLLMISLILYADVNRSFDIQYSDFYHFDSYVFYDGSLSASDEIARILTERNIPFADVCYTRRYIRKPDGLIGNTYIVVYDDDEAFRKLVTVVPDGKKNEGDVSKGLWVSNAYQKYYGDEGSKALRFIGEDGDTEVPAAGFFKYYLTYYQLFMDSDTYETYMGGPAVNNAFMIRLSGADKDELLDALLTVPGYRTFTDYYKQTYNSYGTFKGIANMLVIVYFVLAVILSFMVSLSVLNVFVSEKKRELIIMMINGYSAGKAKLYIFLDTAFITFTGIVLGLVFGCILGLKSVTAFESDVVNFVHQIPVSVFVISAAAVALIMLVLSLIVQRRIGKFRLSDISEGA